jgi:hypothetical protein
MSFQTMVTQSLASINSKLNAIGKNAKRIFELPVQNNLDPTSLIHVSRNGVSESLEVQKIIDAVASGSYDQLLAIGEITLVDNVATIPANAQWKIDEVYYGNIANIVRTIPYCATGLARKDILVANTSNDIVLVQGVETAGITIRPNIPINTVFVTEMDVTDASVGTPTSPIVGDSYIKKSEKAVLKVSILQNKSLKTVDERTFFEVIGTAEPINYVYNRFNRYVGKIYTIKNKTSGNITLLHDLLSFGNNALNFVFPNSVDFILKPNEQIDFRENTLGGLDFIGVIYNTAGKEDTANKVQDIEANKTSTTAYGSVKAWYDWITSKLLNKVDKVAGERLINAAEITKLSQQSGTNTGDETTSSIITKIGDGTKINQSYLPSYVDDVLEFADLASFPLLGESGKIYIAISPKNKEYRWSGSAYIQITNGLIASTDDVLEGSNLYFTTTRALAAVLSGLSLVTGGSIISTDTILQAFGKIQKQINDLGTIYQSILVSGTNIKTINSVSILGSGNLNTPDMDTTTAQNVSGVKTFLSGMFGFRNVANTFTSFFQTATTASRTWIFPDKNGTVAMTSDIIAQLNGTINYLVKFGTTTTGIVSRLFDNGTYFGIGTYKTPTKDITLGYQSDREIGIEESNNITVGRNLRIIAGRTVNYIENAIFNALPIFGQPSWGMCSTPSGNIYIVNSSSSLFKQTGGAGAFVNLGTVFPASNIRSICSDSSNNLYAGTYGGDIYKQTNETGSWVAMGQTYRNWSGLCSLGSNIYASVSGGDIYKLTGGVGNFNALGQTVRSWGRMSASSTSIYVCVTAGGVYKLTNQTGNFVQHTTNNSTGITVSNANDIFINIGTDMYKQTNEIGAWVATGSTFPYADSIWGMATHVNGNIYAGDFNTLVFVMQNNGAGIANLNGGKLSLIAGTGKGNAQSRLELITGQKTISGTDMQVETLRAYFDEDGNYRRIGTPIYADNTAALAGGLTAGMEYKTSTGVKMEVY